MPIESDKYSLQNEITKIQDEMYIFEDFIISHKVLRPLQGKFP
ncbi:hypothetical protein ACI76W_09170 [Capnocytophaga canimorsus]